MVARVNRDFRQRRADGRQRRPGSGEGFGARGHSGGSAVPRAAARAGRLAAIYRRAEGWPPSWGIGLSGAAERATGGAATPLGARWSPASTETSASGEPMAANGNRAAVRASALADTRAVLRCPARRRGRAVSRRSIAGRKDGPHCGGSAFLGPQNGRGRSGRAARRAMVARVNRASASGEPMAANGNPTFRQRRASGRKRRTEGRAPRRRRVSRATGGRPGVGVAAVSKRGVLRGARQTGPGSTRARGV
jgi:hypothetical protein